MQGKFGLFVPFLPRNSCYLGENTPKRYGIHTDVAHSYVTYSQGCTPESMAWHILMLYFDPRKKIYIQWKGFLLRDRGACLQYPVTVGGRLTRGKHPLTITAQKAENRGELFCNSLTKLPKRLKIGGSIVWQNRPKGWKYQVCHCHPAIVGMGGCAVWPYCSRGYIWDKSSRCQDMLNNINMHQASVICCAWSVSSKWGAQLSENLFKNHFQRMVQLESPAGHICLTGCAQTYK